MSPTAAMADVGSAGMGLLDTVSSVPAPTSAAFSAPRFRTAAVSFIASERMTFCAVNSYEVKEIVGWTPVRFEATMACDTPLASVIIEESLGPETRSEERRVGEGVGK